MGYKIYDIKMLATEDGTSIVRRNEDGLLNYLHHWEGPSLLDNWTNQHLYVTEVVDKIKAGDLIIAGGKLIEVDCDNDSGIFSFNKIIATTDMEAMYRVKGGRSGHHLANIQESFLKEFCDNPTYVVEVEWVYEECPLAGCKVDRLRLSDNQIFIKSIKPVVEEKYTIKEIRKIVKYVERKSPFPFPIESWDIENWIKENL